MKSRAVLSISIILALLCSTAGGRSVRLRDSSDWWSIFNEHFSEPKVKASERPIDARNFEIAGAALEVVGFEGISKKLGNATIVERGDASTGREQVCYASPGGKIHLIFEFGEDTSVFYLFNEGAGWKGSNFCVISRRVSAAIGTASGLKLGLSPAQVESILGTPDATVSNMFVYSRAFNEKSTSKEFEEMRRDYPEKLSDERAHEMFDLYPVEMLIIANFTDTKLSYLAVSKSG